MTQPASLRDKVCLITGPTQGIGRAATLAIAKLSPKLVLVVRDPVRGAELADEIRAAGNPNVELLIGDLSKQADVRRIASEFLARHDRLHLLVNNAGAIFMQRQLSSDGLEMTFALNHMAYFVITKLLRGRLKPGARIVTVASNATYDNIGVSLAAGPVNTWCARPPASGAANLRRIGAESRAFEVVAGRNPSFDSTV